MNFFLHAWWWNNGELFMICTGLVISAELIFRSVELKTVSLCKTPLPYFALMHTLPLFYPTPWMPSPYSIHPLHACPLPISSHLMHPLPLFYYRPCPPSPYSILPHACPLPILSQPMHAIPQFYPSPCMPSPYSIPAHAHPHPILSQPMHALSLFYPTLCCPLPILLQPTQDTPVLYSILFQPMHFLLTPCHIHPEGMFLLWHLSTPVLNLLILSISSSFT